MQKKYYATVEVNILLVSSCDVITASNDNDNDGQWIWGGNFT